MAGMPKLVVVRLFVVAWLGACSALAQAESLYQADTFKSLTADDRASRVGDVLTVQVFESSSAVSSADTGTKRRSSSEAGVVVSNSDQSGKFSLSAAGGFDGGGRTQRSNRVLTTVTVTVREIFPNGDLRIGGEQQIVVNEEPQRVVVEGRLRPSDISSGNVVLSTRLADAQITFVGSGDLASSNQRPWWKRFLDNIGL